MVLYCCKDLLDTSFTLNLQLPCNFNLPHFKNSHLSSFESDYHAAFQLIPARTETDSADFIITAEGRNISISANLSNKNLLKAQ